MDAIVKKLIKNAGPALLTLAMVVVAAVVLQHLWRYYMEAPWTRDAHVGADVVQVAPDVSGLVEDVAVADNQAVRRGQLLFVVDRARYAIALEQARAALAERQATLSQLHREIARDRSLQDLVAAEDAEVRRSNVQKAQAAVATAQSAVDLAQLNLDRTQVRSPADGHVSDRTVRVGDYVSAGRPVVAVLDTGSFRVDGYFEETRLQGVHAGQRVDVHLMGEPATLHGHVQSIAAGIEDRYRSGSAGALPNVTPAFDWVRLAQRIPVRIVLDRVPAHVQLIAGRTATVTILPDAVRDAATAPARVPAKAAP
ncbi:efflux RND transporter periplasmic adaptor subunit [Xanthomonas arboricola pv. pruni]|nr:efflux RND transporter periplasmic adaptor subunit [Xanthomonas arboricola pv. juglandis]PPU07241.1 efflux RND transporter periplasmic adaptor subunit [Xanthomonas arboricola pv. corylina]QEX77755.1 efflux RND transporter periplasmic adaptor subunit [Xanthomonas arboricola pv. pruni]PPU62314.1 efflux RND transporter periplasmic adaptor subunit [Xanthomonas arboricola pv. corylina]RST64971.1 efflux RND transporter periplasmic adaptor subunit [Xanthomonas arboricola pv. pruni]